MVCPVLQGYPTGVGYFKLSNSAKSKFKGQDGGITQAILSRLFEEKDIDCVIGVSKNREWKPQPLIISRREDLEKIALSKYTYTPLLETLEKAIEQDFGKIALTGVGCQIHSASLFREKFSEFGNRIALLLGLFCMETFRHDSLFEYLSEKNVKAKEIEKFDITKGKFMVKTKQGEFSEKVSKLNYIVREGCKSCEDFPSYFADISVGSVGSREGWNAVIVRSYDGSRFWEKVKSSLELEECNVREIKRLTKYKKRMVREHEAKPYKTLHR